ncbi:hypothetical protein [Stenoxybacter acetivorans]|uniref:hypothetical protein n=1 Tax=Stenoxybacter acetivorans TaxID=422441 RepID=UPI00056BA985|nr:hypothetical protein [Stenoxybacter acetivorans]
MSDIVGGTKKINSNSSKQDQKIKTSSYIDIFIRNPQRTTQSHDDKSEDVTSGKNIKNHLTLHLIDQNNGKKNQKSLTRTEKLRVLVGNYLRAREKSNLEQVFKILNERYYTFREFFKYFNKVYNDSKFSGVHMGNCRVRHSNDAWFLNFYDTLELYPAKPVIMVLTDNMLKQYQYRNNLIPLLNFSIENRAYIRAFFMNPVYEEKESRVLVKINSLFDLDLRPSAKDIKAQSAL